MGIKSKEKKVVELFFNEGTKHWHFKEISKKAGLSDDRTNFWLKRLIKEKIILHVKPKGKMPYFIANFDSPNYKNMKKIYAMELFYSSGFLNYLRNLNAKTVVLFGSFSRADWYTESDIDLFIVGNDEELEVPTFFPGINREIQVQKFKDKEDIRTRINNGLLQNIINGYFIKGKVQDLVDVVV